MSHNVRQTLPRLSIRSLAPTVQTPSLIEKQKDIPIELGKNDTSTPLIYGPNFIETADHHSVLKEGAVQQALATDGRIQSDQFRLWRYDDGGNVSV